MHIISHQGVNTKANTITTTSILYHFIRFIWITWVPSRKVPGVTNIFWLLLLLYSLRAVKSTSTKHVLVILNECTEYFGVLTRIVTDRGTAFTSQDFKNYCLANDIKHVLNAVRTPRVNGHAERTNRTILSMLLPSTEKDNRWDKQLRRIQWSINMMVNKTTSRTPHQLLFGYQPRDILQNKLVLDLHHSDLVDNNELDHIRIETAERWTPYQARKI